ncbi:MAG: cyclic nucleotide-binding domain-containing protein [Vicinamibacterales bacterium]
MSDTTPLERGEISARPDWIYPVLTPAQIARIAAHGVIRPVAAGEILIEEGDPSVPFSVVTRGRLDVVRLSRPGEPEYLVARHGPGQFTGEVNMVSGRRALFRGRMLEAGEVLQVDRERMHTLLQTDSDLGDILLRAFILRRAELVAHSLGDVVLYGSSHLPETVRIKAFLTRNAHPYKYVDLDAEADAQAPRSRFAPGP